jgi:hypothetical protein
LCDVAQIRDENGFLWAVWLSRTVLEAEWRKAAPKVGDRVTICYEGMKQGGGHPYHDYSLSAEHAPAKQSD